jgi:hypothetical protein
MEPRGSGWRAFGAGEAALLLDGVPQSRVQDAYSLGVLGGVSYHEARGQFSRSSILPTMVVIAGTFGALLARFCRPW